MNKNKTDYKKSVIASIASAICTKTSVAPLERLKVLRQSEIYHNKNNYNKKNYNNGFFLYIHFI